MKTTKITKQRPNPTTPDAAERIEALKQRIRDKVEHRLINMVLDNLGKNLNIAAALYRARTEGWNDGWSASQLYWMGRDA